MARDLHSSSCRSLELPLKPHRNTAFQVSPQHNPPCDLDLACVSSPFQSRVFCWATVPMFFSVSLSLLGSASGARQKCRIREMEGKRESRERQEEPGQRGRTAFELASFLFYVVYVCTCAMSVCCGTCVGVRGQFAVVSSPFPPRGSL